jgi:hypothetical protein
VVWPGGTTQITRFDIVSGGVAGGPQAGDPETGWYWYPAENGRGWLIEVQGGELFLAGFMYDLRGHAAWYVSRGPMLTQSSYAGNLLEYANGQTAGGAYAPPTVNANRGPVIIQFPTPATALVTLPSFAQIPLQRFRF